LEPLSWTAHNVVRQTLARQPDSEAKVRFAWHLAAGTTTARATQVFWRDGTLEIVAKSASWHEELVRNRPMLLSRLHAVLGSQVIRHVIITGAARHPK
jgi:predicted nucleic acid-binding Zn ribbon protein